MIDLFLFALIFFIVSMGVGAIMALFILFGGSVRKKIRQRRFQKAKNLLQKRYPFLPINKFIPTLRISSCCKTVVWEYDNGFTLNFFCDKCGKRYRKKFSYATKEFLEELDYLEYERDLSALNEFWKLNP